MAAVATVPGWTHPQRENGCDPSWHRTRLVEVSSAQFDPDREGVGSSASRGDNSNVGIKIPIGATTGQGNRYLFRLCGVVVPSRHVIRLRGIRQLLTIGTSLDVETLDPMSCLHYPIEKQVVSPWWAFADGNVSWHLRMRKGAVGPPDADSPFGSTGGTTGTLLPGGSPGIEGTGPALLYTAPAFVGIVPTPYLPPGRGDPPGDPVVGSLAQWYDANRFPWSSQAAADDLDVSLEGPGELDFFASVRQTNPLTRPQMPELFTTGSPLPTPLTTVAAPSPLSVFDPAPFLPPEEVFLRMFPDARYTRIAGAMIVEYWTTGPALMGRRET